MDNIISELIGNEQLSNKPKRTQVYTATHEGERYLPFMNRSFISFSFGGKNIEDFNLIATVSGDRWEKQGYADIEDLTTEYDIINGQFYWNTHFKTNTFNFALETDSMTQQQLDEFLRWFRAGEIKELVLAEHPNRAILARVSNPPQISMIPFEMKTTTKLDGLSYDVTTTEYKGSIQLDLVSDDPFWYAKINVFGHFDASIVYSDWINANGDEVSNLYNDPDILKIVFEDGIPLSSMIKETIALGGEVYATVEAELRSRVCTEVDQEEYELAGGQPGSWYGTEDVDGGTLYYKGAIVADDNQTIELATAVTSGAFMSGEGNISQLRPVNMANENYAYFYYAGTAHAPLKLEFEFFPIIDETSYFISSPNNQYRLSTGSLPYNSIWIESIHKEELKLTTPNIYSSYNQIINMFDTQIDETWVQIRKLIRDTVHHAIVRAWANKVIDELEEQDDSCTDALSPLAKQKMSLLFINPDNPSETLKAKIVIDSKTGDAIGTFAYRTVGNATDNEELQEESGEHFTVAYTQENVQDMLLSNNLIIKDRNFPDDNGTIVRWQGTNNITKAYSHRMYHNLPVVLYNIRIIYQNLYL